MQVLDQSIHGSMFVDYNDLVPVPYRRSPLVSLLLPSPREAVLRMIDVDFSRGPNSGKGLCVAPIVISLSYCGSSGKPKSPRGT